MMLDLNQFIDGDDDLPDDLPDEIKTMILKGREDRKAIRKHTDVFAMKVEQVAQRFRQKVYETTDQPDGGSEGAAMNALRSWEDTSAKIKKGMRKVARSHKAAWVAAMVETIHVLAEMDSCPCRLCVKGRDERGDG